MDKVSIDPLARSRKIEATVLQRLASDASGHALAIVTGLSESKISRLKTDHLSDFALMLAHLGLKVVPADLECYKKEYVNLIHELAMPEMARRAAVPASLEWGEAA